MQNSNGEDQDQTILGYPILKLKSMTSCLCEIFTYTIFWVQREFIDFSLSLLSFHPSCCSTSLVASSTHSLKTKVTPKSLDPVVTQQFTLLNLSLKTTGVEFAQPKRWGFMGFPHFAVRRALSGALIEENHLLLELFFRLETAQEVGHQQDMTEASRVECYWKSLKITVEQLGVTN